MSERIYPVKRGGEYEVDIQRLAFGGSGVARIENYVIFVKNTLPGDRALIRIHKRKKTHAEASLVKLLQPSPKRREAPCPYFTWCGGCSWQNLDYEDQLLYKREIISESLQRLGGVRIPGVEPVLPSEEIYGYRNKMEFSFSDRKWLMPEQLGDPEISKFFALGLHVPGTFDKILHIDECLLQSAEANQILRFISDYVQEHHLAPYEIKSHHGFLRFLVLRESRYSGGLMVNLVTAYEDRSKLQPLAETLVERFPKVESVVNNINTRLAQIAFGEKEIVLAGRHYIQEKLGDFMFRISANSFFQTNTGQAERLYERVVKCAGLDVTKTVWDLYAGTGTIGMFLAQQARTVIGFELVESAVRDAEKNAGEHHITNISFIEGDLVQQLQQRTDKPDVIVTDPPRSGMHEKITRLLTEIRPERLVYVSCNPTTLARDLSILTEVYDIAEILPVDMFPHTYHVETVVRLDLNPEKAGKVDAT